MTCRITAVGVWVLLSSCASRPDPQSLENENRNLHGTNASLQVRIDELAAQKVGLDRRVQELEAQVSKMQSTERVVEEAKEEISEHVRQVLARFKGDSDVEVERTATGGLRFVLREAVLFGTAEATLTAEGQGALQRIAEVLRDGEQSIKIEGHTDDVPVVKPETLKRYPRGNMELSLARALSVWEYLGKEGQLPAARLAVAGYGEHRPRVANTSDLNRHRNRRVEILVEER